MRTPRKLAELFALALLTTFAVIAPTGHASAQSTTRSFPMSLWATTVDSDVSIYFHGNPQPDGRSVLIMPTWSATLPTDIEWSRIVAVLVDEPYNIEKLSGLAPGAPPPCRPGLESAKTMTAVFDRDWELSDFAAAVKAVAPRARFWLNLAQYNLEWMMECATASPRRDIINRSYVDVISLDHYYVPFDDDGIFADYVRQYYVFLADNKAKADQQLALIPGTFYLDGEPSTGVGGVDTQESYLQGYFDYAESMNETCNLPLGDRGRTGYFDGCPVWMVLGWLADNYADSTHTYIGEQNAPQIRDAWQSRRGVRIRPDLVIPPPPEKVVPAIMQLLFDN